MNHKPQEQNDMIIDMMINRDFVSSNAIKIMNVQQLKEIGS